MQPEAINSKDMSLAYVPFIVVFLVACGPPPPLDAKKVTRTDSGYAVGRLPVADGFDYDGLRGRHRPDEAAEACEADLECAGFTFRGSRTADVDAVTFFRRYVSAQDFRRLRSNPDPKRFHWTSYRVRRNFVLLPSAADDSAVQKLLEGNLYKGNTTSVIVESLLSGGTKSYEWPFNSPLVLYDVLTGRTADINGFIGSGARRKTNHILQLASLKGPDLGGLVKRESGQLDRCCNETTGHPGNTDWERILSSVRAAPRTLCSEVTSKEFIRLYVLQHRPVILASCADTCPVMQNWTVSDVVNTFGDESEARWQVQTKERERLSSVAASDLIRLMDGDDGVERTEGAMVGQATGLKMLNFVLAHDGGDGNLIGPEVGDLFLLAGFATTNKRFVYSRRGHGKRIYIVYSYVA